MDDPIPVRTPVEFGHAVRRCRRRLDLTQAELAARIGVGRRWVMALEQGKSTVEFGLVLRAIATLGMEFELVGSQLQPSNSILDDIVRGEA